MTENAADPRHGTLNGYVNCRCRCPRCRAAKALYMREKGLNRRVGAVGARKRAVDRRLANPPPPLVVSPYDLLMFDLEERAA